VPGTSIPAAEAALVALLQARPALATVAVGWAEPTEAEDFAYEQIYLGDVDIADSDWHALGASRRREVFNLEIRVDVSQYGDDPQAAKGRAWALWGEVLDALSSDTTLGGTIRHYSRVRATQSSGPVSMGNASGWKVGIVGRVTCEAVN
jgi:hypothetical protein